MLVPRGEFVIVISERLQYNHVFVFSTGGLQSVVCSLLGIIIKYTSHNLCLLPYTHAHMRYFFF